MARYRERKIPIVKFQLSISDNSRSNHPLDFPKMDNSLGIALQNSVKDLVCKVSIPSYPFPVFTFLAENSLRELVMWKCNLTDISLSTSQVASCHSLRKFSLSFVCLDQNLLQTLLNCCPLIVDFIIVHCSLLTNIELRNLQNIKSVSINSNHNQSVKIQAPTLEHLSYSGCRWEQFPVLDIAECQNLKSLELSCMRISRGFLQHLISTSQVLECLRLYDLSTGWERFKIFGSQSLSS
ncbi:uncharacterized protein LOC132628759 [Lycium barbarum]|uniref:uncharacterized protein LOC132628759 n=1 Tax=Lycium barbarum TaxID=112863 RepID=UPI00293F289D|nr:uncharacterized protein LOC132628759 [Lycium barbarum]